MEVTVAELRQRRALALCEALYDHGQRGGLYLEAVGRDAFTAAVGADIDVPEADEAARATLIVGELVYHFPAAFRISAGVPLL